LGDACQEATISKYYCKSAKNSHLEFNGMAETVLGSLGAPSPLGRCGSCASAFSPSGAIAVNEFEIRRRHRPQFGRRIMIACWWSISRARAMRPA
jgi:hypothetical protein